MAVRQKNKGKQQMLPGIMALVTVLLLVLGLMALMGGGREPEEETTAPSTQPTIPENPYGPEAFTYGADGYLTCTAGESVLGIDVSAYQGDIDWEAVKNAGVEFVMIRVGYRGNTLGAVNTDGRAGEYYDGATAAGLKVGAYFFSQAITVQEAIAEAEYAMGVMEGWVLEMPLVFDWEYAGAEARTADMDRRTLTDCTIAFCQTVEQAGYRPMIYFNTSQGRDLLYLEELTAWDWWLAKYADTLDSAYAVSMWQYTDSGKVPGIEGNVDLNLWLGD